MTTPLATLVCSIWCNLAASLHFFTVSHPETNDLEVNHPRYPPTAWLHSFRQRSQCFVSWLVARVLTLQQVNNLLSAVGKQKVTLRLLDLSLSFDCTPQVTPPLLFTCPSCSVSMHRAYNPRSLTCQSPRCSSKSSWKDSSGNDRR